MVKLKSFIKGTYLSFMLLFLYAPIAVLMVFSFNGSRTMGKWDGFSLKWYEALFNNSNIMDALVTTLLVAVLSALAATVMGTFAAIGIHSMKKGRRMLVENVSQLPMINPDLVTGISLMMLFYFIRLGQGGTWSFVRLLLAHTAFNLPYVIFSVMPKLKQSSNMLYEAAMDLGCTPFKALTKVIIPDIMPGIVSGFILAFTLSLDDFVVSYFCQQGKNNLSMYIYSVARTKGVQPEINALSTIMFLVVLTLLLITNLKSLKEERQAALQQKKVSAKVH